MQIFIQVYYVANDNKVLQRGYFKVNEYQYKMNPDEVAAEVAKEWISQLRRENMYKIEIKKVLYENNDITDLIKEAPLD